MYIAAVTLGLALITTPALARPSLWDVPAVDKGLMNIGIAHGVRKNCDTLKAHKLNGISYVWKLVGHAKEAGYSMKETRAFIDDDIEKEIKAVRSSK